MGAGEWLAAGEWDKKIGRTIEAASQADLWGFKPDSNR